MAQSVIVLDATLGGASSNAYLSLADVEILMHQRPFHDLWDAIKTEDEKKAAILIATSMFDNLKWLGTINTQTQALSHPRTGLYDFDGREYVTTALPKWFQECFVGLVFHIATVDALADSATDGLEKVKIGSIDITIDTKYRKDIIPAYIQEIIKAWLSSEYSKTSVALGRS